MCFSKKQRELLVAIDEGKYSWFNKKYEDIYPSDQEEMWKQKKKKYNYYRQLKSRIRKKVNQMEKDLELYHRVMEKKSYW